MMECDAKSKPRWSRRKEARPSELLAAALELFVERGYAATRLDDVAAQAGVSKGTLYLYFANKEELFKAVVRENLMPVLDLAEETIDGYAGPSAQLLRQFLFGWWERIGATQLSGLVKLIMAESGNFPEVARFYHEEVISRASAFIIRMLQRGIERGEFRRIDPVQAQQVIVAPMLMLMMWKHANSACQLSPIAPRPYLECLFDLLSHGLLAEGAPPGSPVPAVEGAPC
jgi:AcrR family transcriptional regulator